MTCTRCGAQAAIKRDNANYCAQCALAREWGGVIAAIQDDPTRSDRVVFDDSDPWEADPVAEPSPADPITS